MNKKSHLVVLVLTILILITEYLYVYGRYSGSILFDIRLSQFLGFTATVYLYIVLITGPLKKLIPSNKIISTLVDNRKYIGLSAWLFALLHGINSFATQLGGIPGLSYLTYKYLFAVAFGLVGLLILCVMAGTSIEPIIKKLGFRNWKLIHKLIYISTLAIVIHSLMLGSHFTDLSKTIPGIFQGALIVLILLECLRFEKDNTKFKVGLITLIGSIFSVSSFLWFPRITIGIHPSHTQNTMTGHSLSLPINEQHTTSYYIPSKQGNSESKFTVNVAIPKTISANTPTEMEFKFYNTSNGDQLYYLGTPFEKQVHVIIVNDSLEQYYHLHPEQTGLGEYSLKFIFPSEGNYRLYIDYQPLNAVEQSQALSVNVVNSNQNTIRASEDSLLTSQKNHHKVQLKSSSVISLSEVKNQNSIIEFSVSNEKLIPVSNIEPYLNTSGHLVLINKSTRDYYHVHAALQAPPVTGQLYGPDLKFLLMETSTPLKTGVYKAFLQFKIQDQVELHPFEFFIQ